MLFCLCFVEVKGDFSYYVLIYEIFMVDEWGLLFFIGDMVLCDVWCNLRCFYDEWFFMLKIFVRI